MKVNVVFITKYFYCISLQNCVDILISDNKKCHKQFRAIANNSYLKFYKRTDIFFCFVEMHQMRSSWR